MVEKIDLEVEAKDMEKTSHMLSEGTEEIYITAKAVNGADVTVTVAWKVDGETIGTPETKKLTESPLKSVALADEMELRWKNDSDRKDQVKGAIKEIRRAGV